MAGVNQPNTFEQFRSLDIRCCYTFGLQCDGNEEIIKLKKWQIL